MNICITPSSAENFMGLFNKVIPSLLSNNSMSAKELIKELYNQTFDIISQEEGVDSIRLKEVILQHLGLGVVMMNKHIGDNPLLAANSYVKELQEMNVMISNSINKDELTLQKMFDVFGTIVEKGKQVVQQKENVRYNAVSLEWARTTVQLSVYSEKIGYKINVTPAEKKYHEDVVNEILSKEDKNLEFKLVKGFEVLNNENYAIAQNIGPEEFVLIPTANNSNYIFQGKTPVFTFKQFEKDLQETKKAKIEKDYFLAQKNNPNVDKEDIVAVVEKSLKDYLELIDESKNKYSLGEEVFFKLDYDRSNKGMIEKNRNRISYTNSIPNISVDNLRLDVEQGKPKYTLEIGAKDRIDLYEKGWISQSEKELEILFHLIKNEDPTVISRDTGKEWSSSKKDVIKKEIFRFFTPGNKFSSINLEEKTVTLMGKEISFDNLTLEDLINASKDRSQDPIVSEEDYIRETNVKILDSVDQVTELSQRYKDSKGNVREAVGPKKNYGSKSQLNTTINKIVDLIDGKIIVDKMLFSKIVLDNSRIAVELNGQGEIKGAGQYVTFIPKVRISKAQTRKKFFTQNIVRSLGSTFENKSAEEWFKNNPLSEVIKLLYTQEYSDNGPQFLASYVGKLITMYKGSEGVLLYHEAFHGFWNGILSESERTDILKDLNALSGSFNVTVLGKKKTINFSEASPLELEEFLAEEFREYATKQSTKLTESNSKIKTFFAKILKALKDFFNNSSYSDMISLGKSQSIVNGIFKDLYTGNFSVNQFQYEASIDQKFASFEKGDFVLSIEDTDVFLESVNSITSFILAESFSHHSTEDNIQEALGILNLMLSKDSNSNEYKELQEELNLLNSSIPSGLNYDMFKSEDTLKTLANFIKITFQDKLDFFKEELLLEPKNISLKNRVELLEKITQDEIFGNPESINDYLNEEEPSTLLSLFFKNNPFYIVSNRTIEEKISERNKDEEERENESTDETQEEVFQTGADQYNSKLHELDALEEQTKFVLYSIPMHSMNGVGNVMVNRLGFPKLRTLAEMNYKLLTIVANSVDAIHMNAKIKAVAEGTKNKPGDNEIAHIYKLLGDIESPNSNVKLWNDFIQSFNKTYNKSIAVIAVKVNEYELEETGEYDEEGEAIKKNVLKTSYVNMSSGQIGNDIQFVKQQWQSAFTYILENGGPYVETDENGRNYFDLEYLIKDYTENLDYRFIPKNYNGNGEGLISNTKGETRSNYLDSSPKAIWDVFNFLSEMGIDVVRDPRIAQAFLFGDNMLNISSGTPKFFLDHLINRKNKLISKNLGEDISRVKDDNSMKIYNFNELFSKFSFVDKFNKVSVSNQENALTNLMKLHYTYSNEFGTFMSYTADGNKSNQMSYHSSLNNMVTIINSVETYDELISIPGFEHFDIDNNVQAQAYSWLKAMFNLEEGSAVYGTRRKDISLSINSISGSKIIEEDVYQNGNVSTNDLGVSVRNSDEVTKYLSDIVLTLGNVQETPRAEAKSSSLAVSGYVYRRYLKETRGGTTLALNYGEVNDVMKSDYKGNHLTDLFLDTLALELLRFSELENIDLNQKMLFDAAYLNRANDYQFFDDILSNGVNGLKTKFRNLKIQSVKELENILLTDTELQQQFEKELKDYFLDELSDLETNKFEVSYPQSLIDKAALKGVTETEDVTTSRMLLTFIINNTVNALNYSNMFLLDFANYNVQGEDFHKRIAGLISTGKGFRFDHVWLKHIENDAFLTATEHLKKLGKAIDKSLLNYDGYIRTAVIQEKETKSEYSDYYQDYLGIDNKEYNEMTEADGQGWIGFDMYRILSRSTNEWSDAQETLYQKIAKGETISSADIKTTFPVRKFQYYGPIKGTEQNVRLSLMGFHKYSLAPLIPTLIKNTPLEKLHEKMMEQGIGYVTMKSGSKLGTITEVSKSGKDFVSKQDVFYDNERNINEDLQFTPNIIHARYLKNQLYLAEGYKGYITLPTQITKIDLIGLFDNAIPTDFKTDKENKKQAWDSLSEIEKRTESKHYDWYVRYKNLIGNESKDNPGKLPKFLKQELLNDLGMSFNSETGLYEGDDTKLIKYIKAQLLDKDLLEEEIMSIIDPSTGKLIKDLSFSIHAASIEKLLTILVDKRLRKMKINGEALVQVSGTMYESLGVEAVEIKDGKIKYGSNQLRFYHAIDKDGNPVTDKDGDAVKVNTMEVIISLQGSYKSLLQLNHRDKKKIAVYENNELNYDLSLQRLNEMMDDDNFRKENESVLTFAGVRIPTQGSNALSIPTIRKFLPEYAGPVIILPIEIVAQSGSDFDIDKLFAMMKNIAVVGGKAEVVKYLPDVTESVTELKAEKKKVVEKIKSLSEDIDFYQNNSKTFLPEYEKIENEIELGIRKDLNIDKNIYEVRKEILSDIDKAERGVGKFRNLSYSEISDILNVLDENLYIIDNAIEEQGEAIKAKLFDLYGTEKITNLFRVNDALIVKAKSEIKELNKLKSEILRKINGKSIKGLQNEFIDLLIERGTMLSNFKDLVTANTTVDAKDMANKILEQRTQKPLDAEYNKRKKKNSTSSKISPTKAMMYQYNLYKHQENFVGMDSLGIAAVVSTFQAMFSVTDGTLQQNEPEADTSFSKARKLLIDYKNATSEQKNKFNEGAIKEAKEIIGKHIQKSVMLNSNKNSEGLNYFGGIKSFDDKNISDLISQMINGYVDVAKDAWVFLIEGTKENTPVLLTMIMLGIPFSDAVRMSTHPLVRRYNSYKKMFQGPYANINSEVAINQSGNVKTRALAEMNYYRDKFSEMFGKGYNEINNLNTSMFDSSELETLSARQINDSDKESYITERDIELFSQYLHIEKIADEMTTVTGLTKFDTQKMSTVNDVKKRIDDTLLYRKRNISENFFGNKFIDYMQNESVVSSKNNDDFISKLFSKQFGVRNNTLLTEMSLKIKKKDIPKGMDIATVRTHFKNDFIWFLYQNSVYSGNNVSIVSDQGKADVYEYKEHASSEIKIENGIIYFNPSTSFDAIINEQEYVYVKKYFQNPLFNSITQGSNLKNLIAYTLTYEKLLEDNKILFETRLEKYLEYYQDLINSSSDKKLKAKLTEKYNKLKKGELTLEKDQLDLFNEKFFLFDKKGESLRDNFTSDEPFKRMILQRAALFLSKNPNALFDSEIGIVPLITNLKAKYPELEEYSLISNMRYTFTKSKKTMSTRGKYNIYFPNLNSDPNVLKRYKENLKMLSNHESPWVKQIFNENTFTHLGLMQTGQSRNVKNDFVRIGNSRHLQNELFNSEVYSKITNTLKQADIIKEENLKNKEFDKQNYLILTQYFEMFSKVLKEGLYNSRYTGTNYVLKELDFVSTVNEREDVLNVKAKFVPLVEATHTNQNFIEAKSKNQLEDYVKALSELGSSFLLLPDTKILMPTEEGQIELDYYLDKYLNVDNKGNNPALIKRTKANVLNSGLNLGPVLDAIKTDTSRRKYSIMAANANKIFGLKTKFLAPNYISSVSNLIDAIKKEKTLVENFNSDNISENDTVWLLGDMSIVKESFQGYSKKEHDDVMEKSFESYKPILDKLISSTAKIIVSPVEGLDTMAKEYFLKNGYYSKTVYLDGIKYYELIHNTKSEFLYTSKISSGEPLNDLIQKIRKNHLTDFNKTSKENKIKFLRTVAVNMASLDGRIFDNRRYIDVIRNEVLRLGVSVEIGQGEFNEYFEQMLLGWKYSLIKIQNENLEDSSNFLQSVSNVDTKNITFDNLIEFNKTDRENILNNFNKMFPGKYESKEKLIEAINDSLKKDFTESLEALIKIKKC